MGSAQLRVMTLPSLSVFLGRFKYESNAIRSLFHSNRRRRRMTPRASLVYTFWYNLKGRYISYEEFGRMLDISGCVQSSREVDQNACLNEVSLMRQFNTLIKTTHLQPLYQRSHHSS